jgi:hypothetical protein
MNIVSFSPDRILFFVSTHSHPGSGDPWVSDAPECCSMAEVRFFSMFIQYLTLLSVLCLSIWGSVIRIHQGHRHDLVLFDLWCFHKGTTSSSGSLQCGTQVCYFISLSEID